MASLESQISSLRDELATVYKTQGQNAQRLLSMNETLREKEELSRIDSESLRKSKDEITSLKRKVDQHSELMAEKDRTVQVSGFKWCYACISTVSSPQILHDEISTLQLELGQIEERNSILTKDNAKLLQRWLDAKQVEANKMNEANEFYENMRSRHQAVLNWQDDSVDDGAQDVHTAADVAPQPSTPSVSGKGVANDASPLTPTKDGIPSPARNVVDLTPNG